MDTIKRSNGEQMVESGAAVRGRRRQFQNTCIHTVVISLMIFATGYFWYITPQAVKSKGYYAAESNDPKSSPNKPFSWSEVCYAVNARLCSRN